MSDQPKHTNGQNDQHLSESIINSLPGVFYLYDESGRFLRWNKNFETVTGYSADEVAGMHPLNFFDTDEQELLETKIANVFRKGNDSVEAHLLTKDKRRIPYYFTGNKLQYQDKNCLVGTGIDITERQLAVWRQHKLEEEVMAKNLEMTRVFERITDAFVALDTNWIYTYVNKKAADHFGRKPEELIGKHIWKEFPEGIGQPFYHAYHRALAEQQYIYLEEYYPPFRRWFENHIYPSPNGLTIFFRDVTDKKQAEAAILESEEKYRYLFNHNPALIFIWDLQDFRILEVNDLAVSTYGYGREELLNMSVLQLRPEEDWPRIREFARKFLQSGDQSVRKSWRHLKKNGDVLYMDIASHRIEYKNRAAILSLAKDITEQVNAEAEIARSEARFRDSMDKMLEGVQIYDRNWNCLYVNDAVTQQGPYSKEDIYARTMPENYPGIEKTELFRIFETCIDQNESRHIEYEFSFPDGTKKWFELSLQPIPEGIFILSIDITERKKNEEEIRNSEEKRRLIMNAALDAIICIDTAGYVTFWNPQAENIFGWTAADVMGKFLTDIIIPDRYKQRHDEGMKRYLSTGQSQMLRRVNEFSGLRADRTEFPIELIVMPVQQGEEHFFCAFIRDITERINARKELQERNEQLRNLSSYLQTVREEERTHIAREIHDELGQQLTVLKMDVASLRNKLKDTAPKIRQKTEDLVAIADDAIQTIRRIITELRPGILDDLGLLAALEWQAKEFGQKTGIPCTFRSALAEDHFPKAINTAVFRIFQESLTNVARHAGATRVDATLEYRDGTLLLEIRDNGKGISDARKNNKTSFGLLGMRERAQMLNGTFDIFAVPGGGTTIHLKIPFTR